VRGRKRVPNPAAGMTAFMAADDLLWVLQVQGGTMAVWSLGV
jgi:hypothetical protein